MQKPSIYSKIRGWRKLLCRDIPYKRRHTMLAIPCSIGSNLIFKTKGDREMYAKNHARTMVNTMWRDDTLPAAMISCFSAICWRNIPTASASGVKPLVAIWRSSKTLLDRCLAPCATLPTPMRSLRPTTDGPRFATFATSSYKEKVYNRLSSSGILRPYALPLFCHTTARLRTVGVRFLKFFLLPPKYWLPREFQGWINTQFQLQCRKQR